MPLQDTDVTLVSRGETNANATIAQLKSHIADGITSYLTWSSYPVTNAQDISSPNKRDELFYWLFNDIQALQFKDKDLGFYNEGDVIVLHNMARSNAGTYKVTGKNNSTNSLEVEYIATAFNLAIEIGDKINITNLGPDVDTDQGNQIYINETAPSSAEDGDLWWQPATNNFHIYSNSVWHCINPDNGPYYKNAVTDYFIDNQGGVSNDNTTKIETAIRELLNSGARTGTLYFPAGTYVLNRLITAHDVGTRDRSGWVIKGDGTSTKFYVDNAEGGISIKFKHKDNYLTVQDLAIHPKQSINGVGLYLQNGDDDEAADPGDVEPDDNDYIDSLPSGGSNQQYGCQIINVNILADEDKPNDPEEKKTVNFFNYPLSLINFGRPRLSRVIVWNHAERSGPSFSNPDGYDYSQDYNLRDENNQVVKPEDTGIAVNLSNCYSPWIDNCYFNGTFRYGIFWNSTRGNTEGGTLTKLVINGPDIGCWVSQTRREDGEDRQGRHPHITFIDSHINSARYGLRMINVKYFHIADILFYSRNDRNRDITLIDCYLTDCHSGFLSNGYSGGAVGNTEKKSIPASNTVLGSYELTESYINGLTNDQKQQAEDDQMTKAPARIHVYLEGTDDAERNDGTVIKNRQILVEDKILNAYIAQTSALGNRTLGQRDINNDTVRLEDIQWRAPYEVTGPCADIHISLPPFNYEGNPAGNKFDSTNYPPENYMITSQNGPVTFNLGGDKDGLIDDGTSGDRYQRMRFQLKNKNADEGTITADSYKAHNDSKQIPTFVTVRTKSLDITDDKETGSFEVATRTEGTVRDAMILREGTAHFPGLRENQPEPFITFSTEPNSNRPVGIYYGEGGQPGNSDNPWRNAAPGSLLLKDNGTMWFKGPDISDSVRGPWQQVEFK